MKKRLMHLILAILIMIPLAAQPLAASGAAMERVTTRAIGIVFDNSGSMYGDYNSSWCRATYAMEVFASMMNDGDQLQIYPMWPITLGKPGKETVQLPLVINGPGEANIVRQIFTPAASGTPFATVTQAYNGLLNTTADEKYLIVLTDGAFDISEHEVGKHLDAYSQDMNVMFLGIGSGVPVPQVTNPVTQYYDRANESSQVISRLTIMCNRIFGRNELEVTDNKITFDVSMSKIIVFVQGEDVSDVQLSGGSLVSRHEMKYSDLGRGNGAYAIDNTLQGMIVTYGDLDAGTYELSYNGRADSIKVYYEPNVDLLIQFLDEGGSPADLSSGTVVNGEYMLGYVMVDKYGVPTTSSLLGDVYYDLVFNINGQELTHSDTQAGSIPVTLNAGDTISGVFTVRYLEDYTCRITSEALGWPYGGLEVVRRSLGDLDIQLSGGSDTYGLSVLEEQAVYDVKIFSNGEPVTDGELIVEVKGGNAVPEVTRTDDRYTLRLKYYGDASQTQCGDQELLFYVLYNGQLSEVALTHPFRIEDDILGMEIALEIEQSYYVIPKMDEGLPIYVNVTRNGAPLTVEDFNTTSAQIILDGLQYELTADPANSRYVLKLLADGVQPGIYPLECSVQGTDTIGRPCTREAEARIECQNYPRWMRIAIWVALGLVIAGLIWAYMNMKVLPKKIGGGTASFVVNGKVVPGKIEVKYSGGGKKRGTLTINSPKYAADPAMKCGMRLELVADSPRRVRSAQRRVRVVAAVPTSKTNTTKMQIGGTNLVKNTTGQFVRMGTQDTKVDCKIANNTRLGVTALILSPVKGKKVTVSLNNLPLKFY